MSRLEQRSGDEVRRVASLIWSNLPVLLCGSALVAAAWAVVRLVPPSLGWAVVPLVGLLVLPPLATLLRATELLLADEHVGVADLLRSLPRSAVRTWSVAALPGGAAVLALAALQLWRLTGQHWMLASAGVSTAVGLTAAAAGVVALPYRLRTRCRWGEGWLVACYVASRNPAPVLAVLSALALAVWAAAYLSFALVLLLPAPVVLVWAAATATVTARGQERLTRLAAHT